MDSRYILVGRSGQWVSQLDRTGELMVTVSECNKAVVFTSHQAAMQAKRQFDIALTPVPLFEPPQVEPTNRTYTVSIDGACSHGETGLLMMSTGEYHRADDVVNLPIRELVQYVKTCKGRVTRVALYTDGIDQMDVKYFVNALTPLGINVELSNN